MAARKKKAKTKKKVSAKKAPKRAGKKTPLKRGRGAPKYPRHSVAKALRVPRAILEQNAGKACTEQKAAEFVGVTYGGPFKVELSSALKYGFLSRPATGKIAVTELAKKVIRPQVSEDEIAGLREAVLQAPDISSVYTHYRGENLPDKQFFENTLVDTFKLPQEKLAEFTAIFRESLEAAKLLERHGDKSRVLDVSQSAGVGREADDSAKRRGVNIAAGDTCFVMMPFAVPLGTYYKTIYEPAIEKAGLVPVRADAEIFATGKIIDQVWLGIRSAKVLVAELTDRNPNVFYELGLAHALQKPVVLVSSNEEDVPFDLQHIRVIYYDVADPFWGDKLIAKVSENIVSALQNPEEAIFKGAPDSA